MSPRRAHSAAAVAAALFAASSFASAAAASAATIDILNLDGPGEGFNDSTPVAPVAGNSATTRGGQRLNVFSAAAAYWANRLASPVVITVQASMDALLCTPTSAVLGAAGTGSVVRDFPNAPRVDTWYPVALGNAFAGEDLVPSGRDVQAQFNHRLDGDPSCVPSVDWWYGLGGPTPAATISFFEVVRHELAHGLGFLTLARPDTGSRFLGHDDIYMTMLEDHSTGKTWPQMTSSERADSARDTGDLHWIGGLAVAAGAGLAAGRHPSGHIRMYAPGSVVVGSSVSHWDTALVPDEVMEPIATPAPADIVTTALLHDLGWPAPQAGPECLPDAQTACLHSGRFEVKVRFQTTTASGDALVQLFNGQRAETPESAFFTFFSPTNFEIGVKVLFACPLTNTWWAFTSGLTDQGWTVTVRDTQTGAQQTYSNVVGHLSSTFADTGAFLCP